MASTLYFSLFSMEYGLWIQLLPCCFLSTNRAIKIHSYLGDTAPKTTARWLTVCTGMHLY